MKDYIVRAMTADGFVKAMAISSTDIRQRSAAGRPVWYLVPDGVVQYIAKNDLYAESR